MDEPLQYMQNAFLRFVVWLALIGFTLMVIALVVAVAWKMLARRFL